MGLKILVPIDFSERSEYALEVTAKLFRDGGAQFILLNVIPLPIDVAGIALPAPDPGEILALERDLQERALARQLAPAIADFGGACARLRASDALVVAPAEVERERILQAFEQGGVDLLDVLDGSARLLAARQEVIDAQGAYVAAVSAIERVLLIDFSALAAETP